MNKNKNYVDAIFDKATKKVLVWERSDEGRVPVYHDPKYYFYVEDENHRYQPTHGWIDGERGSYTSMHQTKLTKVSFRSGWDLSNEAEKVRIKYESDFSPTERILMEKYHGVGAPKIHTAFLDIEVDYDREIGFSSPENPYAPVNAITIYLSWTGEYITIGVPPKGFDWDTLDETLPASVVLVKTERELLEMTLDIMHDVDVVSGWNSEFFDMPYLVRRTEKVLGPSAVARWSFPEAPAPKYGEQIKFDEKRMTVELGGRQHLDYLQLFKKYSFGGRASYSLANISEEELPDLPKLHYEGTLEDLYKNDFNFFLRYNIRDVEVIVGLDKKFKFIDIANELVHENTVRFPAVFGSVNMIDTGIVNFCHNVLKLIVCDRASTHGDGIEGALVVETKPGLHEWVGSVDINSLYPSAIRSINISPEKIIGQFVNDERDWRGIRARDDKPHTLLIEGIADESPTHTGAEWYDILVRNRWSISGYGTVFDQSNGMGIIPNILTSWYADRKQLQKKKKEYGEQAAALKKAGRVDSKEYKEAKAWEEFYDLKQMIRKLLLNSTYGALINEYDRFYDPRLGASTTGTGRQITTHMVQTIARVLTGEVHQLRKVVVTEKDGSIANKYYIDADCIITGDTDSTYFKTGASNKEEAISISDFVADEVNNSFPPFMTEAFCCVDGFQDKIMAGREIVADRALFCAKKKYIARIVNLDGKDIDKGDKKALKIMGVEIKKSDTPKIIQKFLREIVVKIMDGESYRDIESFVTGFRKALFANRNPIEYGVPRSVNKLDEYQAQYEQLEKTGLGKVTLPGHVRATINHNEMCVLTKDKDTLPIRTSSKIKVFYVMPNEFGYKSISVSGDADQVPKWFNEHFRIDERLMVEKLVYDKLSILMTPIGWEVPTAKVAVAHSLLEF